MAKTTATEQLAQRQLDALIRAEAEASAQADKAQTASERARAIREAEVARCEREAARGAEQATTRARQRQAQIAAANRSRRIASLRAGINERSSRIANTLGWLEGMPETPKRKRIAADVAAMGQEVRRMQVELTELEGAGS